MRTHLFEPRRGFMEDWAAYLTGPTGAVEPDQCAMTPVSRACFSCGRG